MGEAGRPPKVDAGGAKRRRPLSPLQRGGALRRPAAAPVRHRLRGPPQVRDGRLRRGAHVARADHRRLLAPARYVLSRGILLWWWWAQYCTI